MCVTYIHRSHILEYSTYEKQEKVSDISQLEIRAEMEEIAKE